MPNIPKAKRKTQILTFIRNYIRERRISPTYEEIASGNGIKAKSQAHTIIQELRQDGLIELTDNLARCIQITLKGEQFLARVEGARPQAPARRQASYINQAAAIHADRLRQWLNLPILGRTFAGELTMMPGASDSERDDDNALQVDVAMLPGRPKKEDLFVLEVRGDSMINANINDGDYIIVQRANSVNNGQMAVVWLEDTQETTLKYFYKEKDHFRLEPANATMKSIIVDKGRHLSIVGKVISVLASKGLQEN